MHDDRDPDDFFLAEWDEDRSNYARWEEEERAAEAAADATPWQDMDTDDEADDDPDDWDDDQPTFY
ncbi:hypothetical protein ABZW03_00860 [Kitasatospora sp. NPDC004799]|uniref:hypothetical protein n=1 Tax=Kitasatospora sp. NPDC004799 TaxID=3154460 RepID=UPI0033A69700